LVKLKIKIMNNELFKIWKEAKTPIDYTIAVYIWFLLGLATVSFLSIIYLLITDPGRFYDIKFGLIDYI
jgi:hypothetical protein